MLKQYHTPNLLMAGGVLLPKLVQWTQSTDQHTRFEVRSTSHVLQPIQLCTFAYHKSELILTLAVNL